MQAAALMLPAQQHFVPYKVCAFCTWQRQQVAGSLFGLQLVILLLQELPAYSVGATEAARAGGLNGVACLSHQ
jgi:hypothetical protein